MKQFMLTLCTLLIIVGCTESPIEEIIDINDAEFYAIVEGAEDTLSDTKTYIDNQIRMRWTAEDKIAMFKRTTYLRQYSFTGKTGANAGGFRQTSVDDEFWYGVDLDNIYAVYPYSDNIQLDETSCAITMNMPAEQTYAENSFGLEANTMIAVSTSGQLAFKNVGSWLRVRLYGEDAAITSVTLTSLGEEAIAGDAEVTATLNGNPTCKVTGNTKSIKLVCPTPVQISNSEDTPTDFWIVVPPVTLKDGLSVTVEDSEGGTQTYEVNKSFTFERNKYYNLKRKVEIGHGIPNNQIWYTSSDDKEITLYNSNWYGVEIVSNTYENGKGIINFDRNVTSISEFAFYACTSLTDIIIPESVKSIGQCAFYGCSSLKVITIPSAVANIGSGAFSGCNSLTNIIIPKGVKNIENNTFIDCSSLTSVSIPEGVISIGDSAFSGCSLASVVIPSTMRSIGEYAFYNCSNLTSIEIPNGVTSIGGWAFARSSNLASVIMPEGVTNVEDYTFYRCSSLNNIDIPKGVVSIDDSAFKECSSLTSVIIPESVMSIGVSAFQECSSITNVIIPEGVTSIGVNAFAGCSCLERVKIPDGVKSIGAYAFYSCRKLQEISLPDSIEEIGNQAFNECANLKSVYCERISPPSIGQYVFSNNASGRIIYVPESSVEAYKSATNWSNYKDAIVGAQDESSLVIIYTTNDNKKLTCYGGPSLSHEYENGVGTIILEKGTTNLGYFVQGIGYTSNLESIIVPEGILYIGDAFRGCENLISVSLPQSLSDMSLLYGISAFYGCSNLKSFEGKCRFISSDSRCLVDENGDLIAFAPAGLATYTIPEEVKKIGNGSFRDCLELRSLIIPEGVEWIGSSAFYGCSNLESVKIPKSVTRIWGYAFYGCTRLKTITIPDNVTSIGDDAFNYCVSLSDVYCNPITPPELGLRAFDNNAEGNSGGLSGGLPGFGEFGEQTRPEGKRTIHVPETSAQAYRTAQGWSVYSSDINPSSGFGDIF